MTKKKKRKDLRELLPDAVVDELLVGCALIQPWIASSERSSQSQEEDRGVPFAKEWEIPG